MSKKEVNLSYLLNQLTEEFYPILNQKQLTVQLNYSADVMISADPEKLARIFDKFYRLADSRSSYSGGAGLGLTIAGKIVTLYSGEISARSENGLTTISVILPSGAGQR